MSNLTRYLIAYDISDPRRLRRTFRCLKAFGLHTQYSVFVCDLTPMELAELELELNQIIHHREDQVMIVTLGAVGSQRAERIRYLGRPGKILTRDPLII